eukprot:10161525-Alexandrium_andersonii.AAC.1
MCSRRLPPPSARRAARAPGELGEPAAPARRWINDNQTWPGRLQHLKAQTVTQTNLSRRGATAA